MTAAFPHVMPRHSSSSLPSIRDVYQALYERDPTWIVEMGEPRDGGWIRGEQLTRASEGPFHELLLRIGARMKSDDKRTIAASFLLRFGWASGMAIAPFLLYRCVPDVRLANVSFRFKPTTFFERAALHAPAGVMLTPSPLEWSSSTARESTDPPVEQVDTETALIDRLRETLHAQAAPVLDALFAWSGFSRRGAWGLLTSSWASQFTTVCGRIGPQPVAVPLLDALFAGTDEVTRMRPRLHLVTLGDVTQVFQRRSSCCRYYLLPQGDLCASCPLVSDEERLAKNRAWMEELLTRQGARASH